MSAAIYVANAGAGRGQRLAPPPRKPTVLVVDDEQAVRQMVQDVLEEEGFDVLVADNGREALQMLVQSRPQLIITDLMMPGMNGRALCQQIRSDPRTATIPVFVMSAAYRAQPNDGFDGVIPKPFEIDELLHEIEQRLAGKSRRPRQTGGTELQQ